MTNSKATPKSNETLHTSKKTVKQQVVDAPGALDQIVTDTTHVARESMVIRKNVLKLGDRKDVLLGQVADALEDKQSLHLDTPPTSNTAESLDLIVAQSSPSGTASSSDFAVASETSIQAQSATVGGSFSEFKSSITSAASSLTSALLDMPAMGKAALMVGGLAATAAAVDHSSKTSTAGAATVQGVVVAGPVVEGNDLFVNAYSLLDGHWISSEPVRLEADGTFTVTVSNWVGPAVFILTTATGGASAPDYLDEALGEAVDLPGALAGVLVIHEGQQFLNISPLSTLAAMRMHVNLDGVDVNTRTVSLMNGTPWTSDPIEATQLMTQEVGKVATAFGLTLDEFNGAIAPAVSPDGQGGVQSATANKYGLVLAALSGLDYNSNQTATQDLLNLSSAIQLIDGQPQLSTAGQSILLRGADAASTFTGLTVQQVASILNPSAEAVASSLDLATIDLQDATQLAQISPMVAAFLSADQFSQLSVENLQALTGDVLAIVQPEALVAWQTNTGENLLDLVDDADALGSITGAQITALLADATATEKLDVFLRTGMADMFSAADFVTLGFASAAPSAANELASAILTLESRWSNGVTLGGLIQTYSDTTPPTVAVASTSANLAAGATTTINFTLSEASTNFAASDVSVTGGTLSGFSGSGTSYSATFTKGATGTGTVSVANAAFSDAAGNTNQDGSDANNTVSIALVDTTPPTVLVETVSTSLAAGATATINFTLSEASTNFAASDVSVTGGTLSNFSGSGTSYSATFTKGATGTGTVGVANAAFSDAAGNTNQDGSDANNTVSIALTGGGGGSGGNADTTPPTVLVETVSTSLAAGATATINFTLSEASTNFAESDVSVTGGTLSGFSGSGTSYSATFTKGATGTGTVSVANAAFSDAAGNTNQDGSDANNTVSIALTDTTPPTVLVETVSTSLAAGATATINFTLSEASTNFAASDVSVTGGTLSNFSGSGTSYSATFTKGATGTGTVSVANAAFSDAAGNTNQDGSDANNTVSIALVDTTPPTVLVETVSTSLAAGATATINFTLSEASTNFAASDVSVTGGTLSNFSGSGTSYTATFTKGATGTGTVGVANAAFSDAAGNTNQDGSDVNNTVSIALVDTTPPTVLVETVSTSLAAGATATINFTLSEASTNFAASDVSVTGGTLSNFSGSGTSYSATFTKGATGTGTVGVANAAFSDAAGNTNQDGNDTNNTVSIALVDTTPPTVTVALTSNLTSLLPNDRATIRFTLSEPSTNFTAGDVSVTGGTLSNFQGGSTTYFATFTKGATGTGTISVASGAFSDAAGNTNQDGSDSNNSVSIALTDNTPPTFTVTSNVSSLSTGQTGVLTFVFDEDVTMTLASMNAGYKPAGIQQYLAVTRIDNRNYQVEFSPQENFMQSNYQIRFGDYSNQIGATDGGGNLAQVGYGAAGTTVTISIDTSTAYLDLLQKIGVNPANQAYSPATYNDFYAAFGSNFETLTGIQNQSSNPSKIETLNAYLYSMTRTNWQKAELGSAIQAISALYDGINQGGSVTRANLLALQITGLSDQNATDALISYIQQNGSLQYYQNWDTVSELQTIVSSDRSPPTLTLSSPTGSPYQPTDSISVSSNEVGYVYLVRNGTSLDIFSNGSTIMDNELSSSMSGSNNNKINKVQITQAGTTYQLSLAGLIGGDYHLYSVDANGNKSAASTDVISIPLVPPTVSLNTIYSTSMNLQNGNSSIAVTSNATNSSMAYLVPVLDGAQTASSLNNGGYAFAMISNGISTTWRSPGNSALSNVLPGEYVVYVKDSETDAVSARSTNSVTVDDTAPTLTEVTTARDLGLGQIYSAKSNEAGYIYLIKQSFSLPDIGNSVDTTSTYSRVAVTLTDIGRQLDVPLVGLSDGMYNKVAVDLAGNSHWSSTTVTIDLTRPDPPTINNRVFGLAGAANVGSLAWGTVYIVEQSHASGISKVADITALNTQYWNTADPVYTGSQQTSTNIVGSGSASRSGLVEGTYVAFYKEENSGNLSLASSDTISFDLTNPTLTYSAARVTNHDWDNSIQTNYGTGDYLGGKFTFQVSEAGTAHLVSASTSIATLNDLYGADRITRDITTVNSPVQFQINTYTLAGDYKLYFTDLAGNLAAVNPNAPTIVVDNTAPSLSTGHYSIDGVTDETLANLSSILNLTSSENGFAYVVKDHHGVNHGSNYPVASFIESLNPDLWNKVSVQAGVSASITMTGLDVDHIDPTNYYDYWIALADEAGNLSKVGQFQLFGI